MKRRLVLTCLILGILFSMPCAAQQSRQEKPDRAALIKRATERHFRSKHAEEHPHQNDPIPGKYLLDRAASRKEQLASRIRAASMAHPSPLGVSSSILPGIQFRGALPAGAIANSVVTGDFNSDGHMDFVVANGATNDLWIYFGNGDGTFQAPRIIPLTKGQAPVYLVTGDLRGNGILDLVVAEFDTSTIGVLLGNGDGTFAFEKIYSLPQPPNALVLDDFNHDGKLDIASVMVTESSNTFAIPYIATLLGDGTGNFGTPVISTNPGFYSTAMSISSGDVNGDGLPDVLVTGPNLENSQIYFNAGNGTFTPGPTLVENAPYTVLLDGRLGDMNGDGCPDAAIADGVGVVWISLGDCAGNFNAPTTMPMGDSNSGVRLADVNGDGILDLVTTSIPLFTPDYGEVAGDTLSVAFGDGHGNFSPSRNYVGTGMSYSMAFGDFNGDDKPDVATVSPDTDTVSVYLNDGSGGFGFPQGEWIGLPNIGISNTTASTPSFADLNGDGKPDVVILAESYGGEYFLNAMLNDGTGRFLSPIPSDAGVAIPAGTMGDYRLGNFRNTGKLDFVGIGSAESFTQYIAFMPGNGDGTFGKPTQVSTAGAAGAMTVGDFNRDGKLDFVTVAPASSGTSKVLTVFLGNGDGTFRDGGSTEFPDMATNVARVFAGDFNRDGKLDILVYTTGNGYGTTSSYVWELLGNGDGTFQAGTQLYNAFQPMTLADVNGDSWPDIVRYDYFLPDGTTTPFNLAKFTTYLDQPSGLFSQSSSYAPYAGVPIEVNSYPQFGDPNATSMVADLNGDGKPDEIAFQHVGSSNYATFVQILTGNGDGTFTPTFDEFAFNADYSVPEYADHLDATPFSDLLEVDGATSSMHVYKGGPAPAFQLALEESQISGTSGCGWIFLNVPSGASTAISLSTNAAGVVLPGTVTVPAGVLSQQFCFTLGPTYDFHQVIAIQAQLGTDTAFAYVSQTYVVGFSETLSATNSDPIYPSQSTAPVTVSVASSQGYTSTLQLSCQGLPQGATCQFASDTLSVSAGTGASTTVIMNTTTDTPQGSWPISILAGDSDVIQRQTLYLIVQPLILNAFNDNLVSTSPGSATGSIDLYGIPPYTPSCAGLPAGVTCSFSGAQTPYPNYSALTFVITVPAGIASGAYPYSINVVSGPASATAALTLNVPGFALEAPSAASDWAPPGGTMNVMLDAQPTGDFGGVVSVTCTLDFGGTCTGNSFQVFGTGPSPISLAVSVPSTIAPGSHTLTVMATSTQGLQTATFPFYVADYSGSLSSSSVSMARDGSATLTATVNATTGFGGVVSLSCSGSSEVACSFTPPSVTPSAGRPESMSINFLAGPTASLRPLRRPAGGSLLALGLALPFGIILGVGKKVKAARRVRAMLFILALTLVLQSCGGGGNGTGGGGGSGSGSNEYAITVNATAAGTNTTRLLGVVNVTVTH
jgi:hypothetical protein